MNWLFDLRLILLVSLSLLLVLVLWRRFKWRTIMKELPVRAHAELIGLHVLYHPERLRAELQLPAEEELFATLLDPDHKPLHRWPTMRMPAGKHVVELPLSAAPSGSYFVEFATDTQRTVRKFNVQRA